MPAVFCARKVYHAIDAGEGSASTAVAVQIELLLGQDVAATLFGVANARVRVTNTIGVRGARGRYGRRGGSTRGNKVGSKQEA